MSRRREMVAMGADPYANTYIHFNADSYINFSPYFTDGGSWEMSVEADCALGYSGDYLNAFIFSSAFGDVPAGKAGFDLDISVQTMKWSKNWKLNGNSSSSTYNPTAGAVADSRALTAVSRGKYKVGIESYDGGYRVYHEFDGTRQLSGPKFTTMANAWCTKDAYGLYNSSCIGWPLIHSSSYKAAPFDAYGYTFKQGGAIAHKLVPARDSSGRGCLYDEITSTFHKVSGGTITINGTPKYIET